MGEKRITIIDKMLGIVTFFLVYSYAMSFIFDILFSISGNSLTYFTVFFALFAMTLSFFDIFPSFVISKKSFGCLVVLFILSLLLLSTKDNYSTQANSFAGTFNSFFVRALPCAIVGLAVSKNNRLLRIMNILVPVVIITSIVMISVVFRNPTGNIMKFSSLGIDRQTLSYLASYCICWITYFLLNVNSIEIGEIWKKKHWKVILLGCAVIDLWPLLAGGGRGAIVVVAFFALFAIFYKIKPLKTKRGLLFFLITVVALMVIWKYVSNIPILSNGLFRITSFFSGGTDASTSQRIEIYQRALELFKQKPILGGGPGYSLCQLHIWSHNIFLDILVDFGVVGFIFFVTILIRCVLNCFKMMKHCLDLEFAFVLGMTSLIMLFFSGSYLSDGGLWFFIAFCLNYSSCYKKFDTEDVN